MALYYWIYTSRSAINLIITNKLLKKVNKTAKKSEEIYLLTFAKFPYQCIGIFSSMCILVAQLYVKSVFVYVTGTIIIQLMFCMFSQVNQLPKFTLNMTCTVKEISLELIHLI